tara:strand:+ start:71 stop:334 length:264 start_codon:yes stop_codon:yes gene_type:complete
VPIVIFLLSANGPHPLNDRLFPEIAENRYDPIEIDKSSNYRDEEKELEWIFSAPEPRIMARSLKCIHISFWIRSHILGMDSPIVLRA